MPIWFGHEAGTGGYSQRGPTGHRTSPRPYYAPTIGAMEEVLAAMERQGNSEAVGERIVSFSELERIVGLEKYLTLEQRMPSGRHDESRECGAPGVDAGRGRV